MLQKFGINIRRQYTDSENDQVLCNRFKEYSTTGEGNFTVQTGNDKVIIRSKKDRQKWYSAEMTLTIESSEEGSIIREVVGPNPGTFTLTFFFLTGGLVILFFALMVGLSQISLNLSSFWSFFVAIASSVFIVLVYLIIWWGRHKAQPEIEELRRFAKTIMDKY